MKTLTWLQKFPFIIILDIMLYFHYDPMNECIPKSGSYHKGYMQLMDEHAVTISTFFSHSNGSLTNHMHLLTIN